MAEWSNALVLKTSEGHTSGGSNPSFSAKGNAYLRVGIFYFKTIQTKFKNWNEIKKDGSASFEHFYAWSRLLFGINEINPI